MARTNKADKDIRIEFPMRGATYNRSMFGVYSYDVYPPSSVLAGQVKRCFLDCFETEDEARAAYPTATRIDGSCYEPPFLLHLSDDDADTNRGMW